MRKYKIQLKTMPQTRPFSKLKKQIESLFVPELKMKVNCISYPVRSQYGSSSIPRFYIQLGKELIWDFPKGFPIKEIHYHNWKEDTGISDLIREYIDTPLSELLSKKFEGNNIILESQNCKFNIGLTDIFIVADRRIGKEKLLAFQTQSQTAKMVLEHRFELKNTISVL